MITAPGGREHVVRLDDLTTPVRLSDLPPAGRRIVAALIEADRAAKQQAAVSAVESSPVVRPGRLRPLPAGTGSGAR